jgi:ABC-type antimicrobial peptide transport system permease subunit
MIFRRNIPMIITSIIIIIIVAEYYIDIKELRTFATELRNWGIILAGFALCLGAGNLIIYHGRHIMERTKDRFWYGIICITTMLIYTVIGLSLSPTSPQYGWLYTNIISPLSMVAWSLPIFWIASACYRAIRVRGVETALLLIATLITLIGFAPVGDLIYKDFKTASDWIIEVPGTGINRGIMIGAGIGTFGLGLRILLGRERGYIGEIARREG